jgi:hypothetical protein
MASGTLNSWLSSFSRSWKPKGGGHKKPPLFGNQKSCGKSAARFLGAKNHAAKVLRVFWKPKIMRQKCRAFFGNQKSRSKSAAYFLGVKKRREIIETGLRLAQIGRKIVLNRSMMRLFVVPITLSLR